MQHAGQLGVNTKTDLAGDDVVYVYPRNGFARDGPCGRVFQRNFFGGRQLGCISGKLTIAKCFFAGSVNHFTQYRLAFALRHSPALGCGLYQHHARRCTCFAQIFLRVADGAAAHTGHIAIGPFAF